MESMTVRVRLFAILRERAGSEAIDLEMPTGSTVAEAMTALGREPGLEGVIGRIDLATAVNRDYADAGTVLAPGDELALIPPVSGGERAVHARVTAAPLSIERIAALVVRPSAGAVVTFQGVTREVDRLDYEAYEEMAQERMLAILTDCLEAHGLTAAAAEHRVGSVPLGEASVVVSVAAGHRGEAFAGAREAIDRIKAEAPIWKREVEGGESRWVEGTNPVPAD
jgi:molybdopterin synthase catalytic subunit